MLYLNPPYYVIDGVSLLPDHDDPLQCYFMPMEPHLSTIEDSSTGKSIPKIQVIKFSGRSSSTGDLVSGGFLDFDCNLGIESDRLTEIAEQLRGEAGLSEMPRLAPMPLIGGSVRMMLFGKETPEEESGLPGRPRSSDEELPGPEFVLKISHYAKPSLYGDQPGRLLRASRPRGRHDPRARPARRDVADRRRLHAAVRRLAPGLQHPRRSRLGPRPDAPRGEREGQRSADRLVVDRNRRRRARRGADHHHRVGPPRRRRRRHERRHGPLRGRPQPSSRARLRELLRAEPGTDAARVRRRDRRLRPRHADDRHPRGDVVLGEEEGRPHAHRPQAAEHQHERADRR